MFIVVARSSLTKKKDLFMPHAFGIINKDYYGLKDEIFMLIRKWGNCSRNIVKNCKSKIY